MFTVEKLKKYGADTEAGIRRCMGKEAFYLQMAGMILKETSFDRLKDTVDAGDLQAAFEAAHALKGVAGNLSLTPLYDLSAEITELLRAKTEMDYTDLVSRILGQREILRKLSEDD